MRYFTDRRKNLLGDLTLREALQKVEIGPRVARVHWGLTEENHDFLNSADTKNHVTALTPKIQKNHAAPLLLTWRPPLEVSLPDKLALVVKMACSVQLLLLDCVL